MKHIISIFLALYGCCLCGCSVVKFTPKLIFVEDAELISALNKVSIKINSENDKIDKLSTELGYQIYNSQLFKDVKDDGESADLVITEYSNSQFSEECGFFNEAIVYLTLLGYVGICEDKYSFKFSLYSPKTRDSIAFGPIEYTKKNYSGWFFAPVGLLNEWHIYLDTPPKSGARDLWFNILSAKREDLLRIIEKIME